MKRIVRISILLLLCLGGCAAPADAQTAPVTPAPAEAAVPTPAPTATAEPTPVPTTAPVPVVLYLPSEDKTHLYRAQGTMREDTPAAIIDELVRREALPDVDYGRNMYFTVGDSFVKVRNKVRAPRVVARLDLSDAFLRALEEMPAERERLTLQSIANTFITHYDAEVCMITIAGYKLETRVRDYEKGIEFDQYAKTREG